MKRISLLLLLILLPFSTTNAYAADSSKNPDKRPITEEMIKKRNATVVYMDKNYKVAISNLDDMYKNLVGAQKDKKYLASLDSRISLDKINRTYAYYKDKITQAYENDKRYIVQYYGE
jgi:hypothetical protein